MQKITMTDELRKKILDQFDKEFIKENIEPLSVEEKEEFYLTQALTMVEASELEGFVTVKSENEDVPTFILNGKLDKNGKLEKRKSLYEVHPGQSFVFDEFYGTTYIFTKEPKKNWKKHVTVSGAVYYASKRYEGLRQGKRVAIWGGASLFGLGKIPTLMSGSTNIGNPRVLVNYHGLVEGAENVKAKLGIDLETGDAMHHVTISVEDKFEDLVKKAQFVKGDINPLNSPVPVEYANDEISKEDATLRNFERIQANNAALIGNTETSAQITQ